jgi:hypothetical protein
MLRDLDRSDDSGRFRPCQVDREQSVLQVGLLHLHAVRQHESALKLAGGDAAMQKLPALVILLASPDDELFLLDGHLELLEGKSRNGQSDPQAFGVLLVGSEPFDVVWGIAVCSLATRSSARSIWSKPMRNGLDNDGTRDIFKALALSDFDGAQLAPPQTGNSFADPNAPNMGLLG